jgi:hypothetical protein
MSRVSTKGLLASSWQPLFSVVMRGLDPRIHREKSSGLMDCRVKSGNDGSMD